MARRRSQIIAGLLLGSTLLLLGCRSASLHASDHELRRRVEAQSHFAAGVVRELNEDAAGAAAEFVLAARVAPTDRELLIEISTRLIEARQFPEALEVLTLLTKIPDAPSFALIQQGFVYAQLGQLDKSIAVNEIALRRQPKYFPIRRNLFLNHLQAHRPADALKVLDTAAAQPGIDADFLISLAELYATFGNQFPDQNLEARGKSLTALNRAAAMKSLEPGLQIKLADGLNLLGDTKGAAKLYLEAIGRSGISVPLRELLRGKLVDIYLRGRDNASAAEQLAAMVRDNPNNASAYYFLGSIEFEQKRWTNAVANFQRAVTLNPELEQAHYDLASAQMAGGRSTNAIETLLAARRRFPSSFAGEYLLGMAYHDQKQPQLALEHFISAEAIARAGETNRLNTGFYFQIGAAHERAGNRAQAEVYFEKSLALAPDNAEALNYLGYMWVEKRENLDRARDLIERALKLEPDNAAFLDSMGWLYFQVGQPEQAIPFLEKAIAVAPNEPDATVYDHLGDACAAAKQWEKARAAWTKSLALEASEVVQRKLTAAQSSSAP